MVQYAEVSSFCFGSYLLTKQFVINSDPKISKKEAAAFFIGIGVWNQILATLWKEGARSTEDEEERKILMSDSVVIFCRFMGALYAGVGYFGYLKNNKKAYYGAVFASAVCILNGLNLMLIRRKNDFLGWVGVSDLIKGLGYAMMLKYAPLK